MVITACGFSQARADMTEEGEDIIVTAPDFDLEIRIPSISHCLRSYSYNVLGCIERFDEYIYQVQNGRIDLDPHLVAFHNEIIWRFFVVYAVSREAYPRNSDLVFVKLWIIGGTIGS